MEQILEFLRRALSTVIDSFKMKNPQAFAFIAGAIGFVVFGVDYVTENAANLSDSLESVLNTARTVAIVVLTLLGAHTPKPPETKVEK